MTSLPIEVHPLAQNEADEAFEYYRERSWKVAQRFLAQLAIAREAIQQSPDSWQAYLYGTRRYLVARYPYVVVYRARKDRIEIIAFAHGRRKPGY